jgi:hypothetical protein
MDKKAVKGWFGEKLTAAGLWLHLDQKISHRVHDIILSTSNGTTQIDKLKFWSDQNGSYLKAKVQPLLLTAIIFRRWCPAAS